VAALDVAAPDSGVLRNVQAAPGQMVASGTPLFEVLNQDVVWVRVPVYSGDVATIVSDKPARVGPLGAAASAGGYDKGFAAKPVEAPPSADPLASTVDLFFELENKDGAMSPGQKVGVTLSLRDEQQSLLVPWSAVVFDVYGGAWVYENTGPQAYARRRVQVRHVVDGQAVLASGPAAGTKVLTEGAAEVFGFEMGFAK
jgi:multidrug efflux pump subunit AcrA (membrane-fusion protein)